MLPGSINKANLNNINYNTNMNMNNLNVDNNSECNTIYSNFTECCDEDEYCDSDDSNTNVASSYCTDKNKYSYDALKYLQNNIYDIENFSQINNIYLCIYKINNESLYPFLQYLLVKDNISGLLTFPFIRSKSLDSLIDISESYLDILLKDYNCKNSYTFNGFFQENNDIYLFFDISENEITINDHEYNHCFSLMDEIINYKSIGNNKINSIVSDFFVNNNEFIFLQDEHSNKYEIPISVYNTVSEKSLNFTYMFGISKSDYTSIMGPYYYFTDFNNAIKNIPVNYNKYGLIRFAVFLGKMKVPMNFIDDEIDTSEIKKDLLTQEDKYNSDEIQTMRISDHDGKWSSKYDSVYLGKIELDDGQILKSTPTWVVKNFNQQIPLTSYLIYNK
jgi:hypothetical protein